MSLLKYSTTNSISHCSTQIYPLERLYQNIVVLSKSKVLPELQGPQGGADLRFLSPHPDTSLTLRDHGQCIVRCARLLPSFR